MSKACGLLKSDVEAGRLTHADQEAVNDAREGARKRAIGTAGGWGYDRSNPSVNIAPLVAVTLARLGASMTKKPATEKRTGGRRVVTG
jgi:anthranilate phosphoribosyltransferase